MISSFPPLRQLVDCPAVFGERKSDSVLEEVAAIENGYLSLLASSGSDPLRTDKSTFINGKVNGGTPMPEVIIATY